MININQNKGFTLVEVMIAVSLFGLILGGVMGAFRTQKKSYESQDQVTRMLQNARASLAIMESEIRMAGYQGGGTAIFGITDVSFRDSNNNLDPVNGESSVTLTAADFNGDGSNETISYSIFDSPVGNPDGLLDLARNTGAGRQLLGENIQAMGLAYAYDSDNDGQVEFTDINGNGQLDRTEDVNGNGVLDVAPFVEDLNGDGNIDQIDETNWAIDSDNDGLLDRVLDFNSDGQINAADGPGIGNTGTIGGRIIGAVALTQIRAVKIWLLARSPRFDTEWYDSETYVVGRDVISPQDGFRRRLFESTVICRNMGM